MLDHFNDKFEIGEAIGSGGTSIVYKAIIKNTGEHIAIKHQKKNKNYLQHEHDILKKIVKTEPIGFSKLYGYYGVAQDEFLALELLDYSLYQLHKSKPIPLNDVVTYGLQILERIEYLHSLDILHCDIKPGNFMKKNDIVYLVDFGISSFVSPMKLYNMPFRGTKRYSSRHVHKRITYDKRDDLISLIYSLIWFVSGDLPWKDCKSNSEILDYKRNIDSTELTKNCPLGFELFYLNVNQLKFGELPNYLLLISYLHGSFS